MTVKRGVPANAVKGAYKEPAAGRAARSGKPARGEGRVNEPLKRLLAQNAAALADRELLALLLQPGSRGPGALEVADGLLARFGDIGSLLRACKRSLLDCAGVGPARYAQLQVAVELARRQALQRLGDGDVLNSPAATRRFLQYHLGGHDREVFCCLFLDSQHRVLRCENLFLGTLDGAAVYPREVAVRALQNRAAAVIFAHNHPSGVAEPSSADKRITERLQQALSLLDIRVLDHIIVGSGREFSFAQEGLI